MKSLNIHTAGIRTFVQHSGAVGMLGECPQEKGWLPGQTDDPPATSTAASASSSSRSSWVSRPLPPWAWRTPRYLCNLCKEWWWLWLYRLCVAFLGIKEVAGAWSWEEWASYKSWFLSFFCFCLFVLGRVELYSSSWLSLHWLDFLHQAAGRTYGSPASS
jgi:hypothetical protein